MDATLYGLAEATVTRPVEDFLMAMYTKEPNFTSAYMVQLKHGTKFELTDLLENFRVFIRMQKALNGTDSNSAFAATKEDESPSFKEKLYGQSSSSSSRPRQPCVCGSDSHRAGRCFYLNSAFRPQGWKSKASTQATVDEAMKDEETRKRVAQSIEECKKRPNRGRYNSSRSSSRNPSSRSENQDQTPPPPPPPPVNAGSFAISAFSSHT